MKKLTIISLLLFATTFSYAQDAKSALKWLNNNKSAVKYINTSNITESNYPKIEFDLNKIKVYTSDSQTEIPWGKINEITLRIFSENLQTLLINSSNPDKTFISFTCGKNGNEIMYKIAEISTANGGKPDLYKSDISKKIGSAF